MIWFVTPVFGRLELTRICLEQRARMLAKTPFESRAVIVGDDENMKLAREFGLDIVEKDNKGLGAKFNAGYMYALEHGATHCMGIGSDSWLHHDAYAGVPFAEREGYGLVGLSSFGSYGEERVDLENSYPAGFGVGMMYPAWALQRGRGGPCEPTRMSGIDVSTWSRCGRGVLSMKMHKPEPFSYTNFHSPHTQVTHFQHLRHYRGRGGGRAREDIFSVLRGRYDDDLVDLIEGLYVARAVGVFFSRKPATTTIRARSRGRGLSRPTRGPKKRRLPTAEARAQRISENFRRALDG